ncbi:MAG: PD-(D/E)XK nuclease family transposase, partial [Proteobacteria bacterium]|nr:PD-(D/E)XK nuclease family transposase [Pseudomonadota bacterium]
MFQAKMSKKEVQQVVRNIIAFRQKIAPFDLYSDSIIKHLLFSSWFIEALLRRALLLSPECQIDCTQMRYEIDESMISSADNGLKKPVLDGKLFVTYKEPGEGEHRIIVSVDVQKRLGMELMARLAFNATSLIYNQINSGESHESLRHVYTVTLTCENMARFRDKPEQYLHFTCGDELLERTHKVRNMLQHVFLEVNKFNKDTDGVNSNGCILEAFMYIAKRWQVLTEEMLEEIILAGGYMAEAAFKLSQLNTTLTEDDVWLDIER